MDYNLHIVTSYSIGEKSVRVNATLGRNYDNSLCSEGSSTLKVCPQYFALFASITKAFVHQKNLKSN